MRPFDLTILGCSSATPTSSRHPTSQLLELHGHLLLIDCGEGTQVQLRKFKFKIQRINHIFISHLHGDHYLGLPGLISTMHLLGRTNDLHIYSPAGLEEIINISHYHSKTHLNYQVIFHTLEGKSAARILDEDEFFVEIIPMRHRIPCYGFLFREKKGTNNIIKKKIEEYNIPLQQIVPIKKGKDFITSDGIKILNAELTIKAPLPRTYAYASDTLYNELYIDQIKEAGLLYHEATFASDMADRARATFHCTAKEAGMIALKANVHKLIIGHFSARYHDLTLLLSETKEVFPNTALAVEGEKYAV